MIPYELTQAASEDLFAILENASEHHGLEAADKLGLDLITAFRHLASNPGPGA